MITYIKNLLAQRRLNKIRKLCLTTPLISCASAYLPNDYELRQKLNKVHPEWDNHKIVQLIEEYRNFLFVAGTSKTECTPSAEVDEVWHQHMLFTRDYREFCRTVFGKFIDHNPEKSTDKKDYSEQYLKTTQKINVVASKPKSVKKKAKRSTSKKNTSGVIPENNIADSMLDVLMVSSILNNHGCSNSENTSSCSSSSSSSSCSSSCSSSSCSSSSSSSSCSSSSSSCSSSSCGGGGD
jgi:hypothetical protein